MLLVPGFDSNIIRLILSVTFTFTPVEYLIISYKRFKYLEVQKLNCIASYMKLSYEVSGNN